MTKEEFLQNLQIVELTRVQPKLKIVHDACLQACIDHASDLVKMANPPPPVPPVQTLRRIEPKPGDE